MNKPMKRKKLPQLSSSMKEVARTTSGRTKMTMLGARRMQRLTPQTMLQPRRVSPISLQYPLKSKTRRKLRQQQPRQLTLSRKPRLLLTQHPRHSSSKSLYNSSSRQLSHATHHVNGSFDGEKPCFLVTSRVAFSTRTIRR